MKQRSSNPDADSAIGDGHHPAAPNDDGGHSYWDRYKKSQSHPERYGQ